MIPARNEERTIGACLASLRSFAEAGDALIVVDDGSTDRTREIAGGVLASPRRGRGYAVAAGVAAVVRECEGIVILHADMLVPEEARAAIVRALERAPAGFLGHRIDDRRFRFRLVEWGNGFRARVRRLPYGDQGQFFRSSILETIGGFPEQERLEDLELALRLRGVGAVVDAGTPVTIPARHWERGVVRAVFRNTLTWIRYRRRRP